MQDFNYKSISAIILSGGKSSRMGRDKCDLIYGGKTLINVQVDKIRQIGIDDIVASGYRGKSCNVKIIEDNIMKGPLSGVLKGLSTIKNDRAYVTSVDTPLVRAESIIKTIDYSIENDLEITILRHNGTNEPLIGVFKKCIMSRIEDIIKEEKHSVMKLVDICKSGFCDVNDDDKYFMNINYKEDYDALLKM